MYPEPVCYAAAAFDLFGRDNIHDREHDLRDIFFAFRSKVQHLIKAVVPFRAAEPVIFIAAAGVHRNRHDIHRITEQRRDIFAVYPAAEPVGIEPNGLFVSAFEFLCGFKQHIELFGRFTIAAEYYLIIAVFLISGDSFKNLTGSRLSFEPQAVRAVCAVAVVPDAERAGAGAFIGKIHIKIPVYLVHKCKRSQYLTSPFSG